jgi:hypothetical protein
MQKLTERHSATITAQALRYLSIRLKSRPETQSLISEIETVRSALATAEEAYSQAKEERMAATAEINYLDGQLDQTVMALAREVGVMTRNKTQDPRYMKLFPTAPSALIRPIAGESQERFVRSLINRLQEDADYAGLKPYAETMEKQQQLLNQAGQRREQLYQPEVKAQTDQRIVLDQARRLYQNIYHRLQLLFPTDAALVESFFMDLRSSRKNIESEEDVTTETMNASAGQEQA